jgi:eukaryotic-like serine/threonine-protein kinase
VTVENRLVGNRYKIIREIAAGGMGTVYEAQHHLTKQTVALKVLFPQFARDEAAQQRFRREVSAPARINHDGICKVFDADIDPVDGSLFVAMELLEGETFRARLDRHVLTGDQTLDYFERILEPLAQAHAKGIVHRDMKPENIYIATKNDGTEIPKILDFGIVREVTETNVTQANMGMGTPDYMSPEQATSAKDVTAASDVWSMGIIMYEGLAGRLPFQGATPSAVIVDVITRPHAPLRSVAPQTPPAIADLVDRCLSKDPDGRPRNAGEVLAQLRQARGGGGASFPKTMYTPSIGSVQPMGATPPPGGYTPSPQAYTPAGPFSPPTGATPPPGYGGTQPPNAMTPPPGYGTQPPNVMAPGGFGAPPGTPPAGFGSSPGPFSTGAPGSSPGYSPPAGMTPPPGTYPPQPGFGPSPAPQTFGPQPGFGQQQAPQQKKSSMGCILGAVGGVLALIVIGIVVAVVAVSIGGEASTRLRINTNVTGAEVWIDGENKGTATNEQIFEVAPGSHRVEIRQGGQVVVADQVTVTEGGFGDAMLFRLDQTLQGELAAGDSTLPDGKFADNYNFEWPAARLVEITLESAVFDTVLILQDPAGGRQENDDFAPGQNTNSRISVTTTQAGMHTVTVTSYQPGLSGAYTLNIRVH